MIEKFLFELLRISIGIRGELSRQLTDVEWTELHSECVRQNVLGIAFVGIQRLPDEQLPPSALYAKWKHEAEIIKERFDLITKRYREACDIYEKQGVGCCVLMPSPTQVRGERLEIRGGDSKDIDILCWTDKDKEGKRMVVEYVNFQYVASTHHIKPKVVRLMCVSSSLTSIPHCTTEGFSLGWKRKRSQLPHKREKMDIQFLLILSMLYIS